ncbi:hypothetical protein CU098_010121 [Rhizopus stolonifer]|uniref:Uncharacterized protein n=1 Tax=Rhizopus stolonifer TaxID=4846 RepID=A0A367KKH9_RHIST|nr:hypothetical protein CU098_010121 [Rhizopus stolonifer]
MNSFCSLATELKSATEANVPRDYHQTQWSTHDVETTLKKQVEDACMSVAQIKTTQKHISRVTSLNDVASLSLEHTIHSLVYEIECKTLDREKQTNDLRILNNTIRKEVNELSLNTIKGLEYAFSNINDTLNDPNYSYESNFPLFRDLSVDTAALKESIGEIRDLLGINKIKIQESSSKLMSIARTIHELRKDIQKSRDQIKKFKDL